MKRTVCATWSSSATSATHWSCLTCGGVLELHDEAHLGGLRVHHVLLLGESVERVGLPHVGAAGLHRLAGPQEDQGQGEAGKDFHAPLIDRRSEQDEG